MKRSDFFIRLTTGVLFLAVVSYIGIYIYNAVANTFVTTPAISYSIEETFPAEGFIIRTEAVLADFSGNTVLPIVGEGERVANGQAVAVEYLTREALEAAGEIRSLQMRIAQLEAAGSGRASDTARLESVMNLSWAVRNGDMSRLDEMALNIETLVFDIGGSSEAGLDTLRANLEALQRRNTGVRTLFAPFSGTFSQVVDGFEHVEPRTLNDISPTGLGELFESPSRVTGVGKLVTSFKWYFAAVMDAEDARRLRIGNQVTLQLSDAFHADKSMLVESISRRDDDGMSVVVFSSDRGIHDVVGLRRMSAEIVFDVISGIRVPKEALHLDDDGTLFIFLQTGARAERVNIEVIREYGDVFLVRDGIETGSPLRSGSTIIVRANNLYHGKVVG
ncbi:MAG: hypothetical protein FWB97_00130 [Oscillospiraceae bacterium]|nr:hypothetical protein [Oscillospiraceae bacterium]